MRIAFLVLTAALLPGAQDGLPEARLKALKAATLYVRQIASSGSTAGPGFVFHRTGDSCLIATSLRSAGGRGIRSFFVIQHSGTPEERKFPAELVGEDPDFDMVVLRVSIPDPPEPVAMPAAALRETVPVFILGYPLGDALARGGQNPSIVIGRGTIGSLRRSPKGELVRIQLDADVGMGNSGAPVVDREGRLVGLAGGRLEDTKISAAFPAKVLEDIVLGRAFRPDLTIADNKDGLMRVQVSAGLHDPGNRLKSVSIFAIRRDQVPGELPIDAIESWEQASPDMKETVLTIRGGKAVGDLVLQGDAREDQVFLCQVKQVAADGKVRWSGPWEFKAAFGSTPKIADTPGRPARRPLDEDWLGSDEERRRWASGTIPTEATDKPLDVGRSVLDGLEVIKIPLGLMGGREFQQRLIFSRNGQFLYFFGKDFAISKIRVPDFVEERRSPVGRPIEGWGWTKEGLALRIPGGDMIKSKPGEIWIYHPDTLERIRQVALPDLAPTCFLPEQGHILLCQNDKIRMLDLKSGAIFKETVASKAASGAKWFDKPGTPGFAGVLELSPDGRLAHPRGGNIGNSLNTIPMRISLEGGSFRIEEVGAPVGPIRFFFGHPESKFAAVWGGNPAKLKGHPEMKGRGVIVYRANDLSKALCFIPEVEPLCGGPTSGQFWGLMPSGELALFDDDGKKIRGWYPFSPGVQVNSVIAPSTESALLVNAGTSGQWTWFRLPKP